MPAPEYRDRWQPAVLWPALNPVQTDDYAVIQVGPPVQIQVQWKLTRKEVQAPDGSTVTLDATVKVWGIADVPQDIWIGSHIWLGTLASWYGVGSSGDDNEVRVVMTFNRVPDPKNRWQGFELGLMRWRSQT